MEIREYIEPGMSNAGDFEVEERYTAAHVGSGSLRVLATPSMIAFMERTARDLLEEALPDGYSSVGVHVDVRHVAPTPMGGHVHVACQILQVHGRSVDFSVKATDNQELIGEGRHQRIVIDVARFLQRVQAKKDR